MICFDKNNKILIMQIVDFLLLLLRYWCIILFLLYYIFLFYFYFYFMYFFNYLYL
ncbi:hypothetical protein LY90DRAFT_30534 [Neocallimastix californiae]|uniref:Uncharacterized protein n=1 Tax=Neocallimastix californiae TaxID=1754190 RepID=A0A1Y2C675_9FUNG|nr:hypothetical protein LY90DRAFT_30534 [Neocallimastix californiae]|eukprot:ORY42436.1 hypothetical protein LY90DRAFT_30534 [Neocallimastix californiae]